MRVPLRSDADARAEGRGARGTGAPVTVAPPAQPQTLGRYALYDRIASGGMATVYFGQLIGTGGFSRIVAIKRLHPHLALEKEFAAMLLDEAYLAGRIRHPNVVSTLDVVSEGGELFLVMEYVHGETLARLLRAAILDRRPVPQDVSVAIVIGALNGLHAAHETTNEKGEALAIVHRDVSPQNVVVGVDGVARLLDFGVAKARNRLHTTQDGTIKGKLRYMAAEQLTNEGVDRRADVYGVGVILWELLTGQRLFDHETESATMHAILRQAPPAPSRLAAIDPSLDAITLRALARDRTQRFETARQMAVALEQAVPVATPTAVGEWVTLTAEAHLRECSRIMRAIDASRGGRSDSVTPAPPAPPTPATSATPATPPHAGEPAPTGPPTLVDEPMSQRSEQRAAVVQLPSKPPPRPRPPGWVYGLGGAALATIVSLSVVATRSTPRGAAVATNPDAPDVAVAALSPNAPTAPAAPTSSASASAAPLPATTAATSIAAPPPSPLVRRAPAGPPPRKPPRAGRAADPECSPPYTIDLAGVRHYKVSCPLE